MTHEKTHTKALKNNGKNKLFFWIYKMGYNKPPNTDPNLDIVIVIPIANAIFLPKNHLYIKIC